MIGKTLQEILDEKGSNPNELANIIGVSNQTIYSIIKRDNMKIDLEVLFKICKALNVSIERFYSDYCNENESNYVLSQHERDVISAYRNHPDMQKSVDKLLGIEESENIHIIPKVARSGNTEPLRLTDSEIQKLKNLPDLSPKDN